MKMLTMWKVAILEEGISYLSFSRLHNLLLLLPLFHLVGKEWSSVNHLQNLWFSKNKLLKPSSKSLVVKEWNSENHLQNPFVDHHQAHSTTILWIFSGSWSSWLLKHNHHEWLSPLSWLSYRTKKMIDNHLSSNQLGQAGSEVWTINLKIQESMWLKSLQFCHPCQVYHCHRVFHSFSPDSAPHLETPPSSLFSCCLHHTRGCPLRGCQPTDWW